MSVHGCATWRLPSSTWSSGSYGGNDGFIWACSSRAAGGFPRPMIDRGSAPAAARLPQATACRTDPLQRRLRCRRARLTPPTTKPTARTMATRTGYIPRSPDNKKSGCPQCPWVCTSHAPSARRAPRAAGNLEAPVMADSQESLALLRSAPGLVRKLLRPRLFARPWGNRTQLSTCVRRETGES
jgi:hypothetical protein